MLRGLGGAVRSIWQRRSRSDGRTPMKNYIAILMILLMASSVYSRERRHSVTKTASLRASLSSLKASATTDGTGSNDSDDDFFFKQKTAYEIETDDTDTDDMKVTDNDDNDSTDMKND